jgi:hypothetical protein
MKFRDKLINSRPKSMVFFLPLALLLMFLVPINELDSQSLGTDVQSNGGNDLPELTELDVHQIYLKLNNESNFLLEELSKSHYTVEEVYVLKYLSEYYQQVFSSFNNGHDLKTSILSNATIFLNNNNIVHSDFYSKFIHDENAEWPYQDDFISLVEGMNFSEGDIDDLDHLFNYFNDLINL